jgi:hypothetical protein
VIARLVDEGFVQVFGKFLVLTDRGQRLARLGMHPSEYVAIKHLVGADNAVYEDWVRALCEVCGEHALRGKRKPNEEEIKAVVAYGMTAHMLRTPWATRELADYLSRLLELSFNFMEFNKVGEEFRRRWRRDVADWFLFGTNEFARALARVLPRPAVRRVIRNFGPSLNRTDPTTGETLPLDDAQIAMLAKVIWSQVDPKRGEIARVAGILGITETRFRRIVAEAIGKKETVNV